MTLLEKAFKLGYEPLAFNKVDDLEAIRKFLREFHSIHIQLTPYASINSVFDEMWSYQILDIEDGKPLFGYEFYKNQARSSSYNQALERGLLVTVNHLLENCD